VAAALRGLDAKCVWERTGSFDRAGSARERTKGFNALQHWRVEEVLREASNRGLVFGIDDDVCADCVRAAHGNIRVAKQQDAARGRKGSERLTRPRANVNSTV